MFNSSQLINLSRINGWIYAKGNNPAWARPTITSDNWSAFKPADLSVKDADQNGKVEGWFRLKFKLDSTWEGMNLGLANGSWAATDVYIDGRLVASFGNTGTNGKPQKEHYHLQQISVPVQLVPGQVYLLAVHLVDYVSPFPHYPGRKLQSEVISSPSQIVQLVGPRNSQIALEKITSVVGYTALWFGVWLLMAICFWLLAWLNLYEKNSLQLLAILGTFAAVSNLCRVLIYTNSSFITILGEVYITTLSLWLTIVLALLTLMTIFGYQIKRRWFYSLIVIAVAGAALDAYIGDDTIISIANLIQQLAIIYLLISSWKRLQGAQWAIVAGALVSIVAAALFAVFVFAAISFNFNLLYSVITLAFPFSFLLYIALRFREILAEVQLKSAAVVKITEEKREILAAQNELLEQQVEARTAELEASQAQLIQKEKLASLGELTAGIAHEIQNPLNFVNNFSEVSTELIDELKEGPLQKLPESEKDYAEEILGDLSQNLQKIRHHGGRASSIVKGMLEHSRPTTGDRQLTDMNALIDEYLRLAYQGQRNKDKTFQCELITAFDLTLGKAEVVPAEIGRVLLNLYNNAFYAVNEQRKAQHEDYIPTVWVNTHQKTGLSNRRIIEIRIADNGPGIADTIKAKIFQPFFTTKPTGEGTGLGLSLSYDIITKGHQGTLQVVNQEGKGAQFIIQLSQSKNAAGKA
jgi:signal transduction histidine kinase